MDTNVIIGIVAVIIILIVLYMKYGKQTGYGSNSTFGGIGSFWTAGSSGGVAADSASPGMWTVYGSDKCGWTLKQLAVFDNKGIPYNYINCDNDKSACKNTSSFPTLVDPNGVKTVGFNGLA